MQPEFIDVMPVLACSDIAAEHDFLVSVLGFASGGLERAPNGTVAHGEVRAGERRIPDGHNWWIATPTEISTEP